jgi:F-type H+-transporting ATPase subunit c
MLTVKKALVGLTALVAQVVFLVPAAFAQTAAAADNDFTVKMAIALAAGLGLGIAAFGGAMAQGKAAAAALEGIARNPGASGKIFTPLILGLALIESLVIYSLVISFTLVGKL